MKLLNGERASTTTAADAVITDLADVTAGAAFTHIADGAKPLAPQKGIFTLDLTQLEMRNDGLKSTITGPNAATITATEGTGSAKASITFDLSGLSVAIPKDATTSTLKIKVDENEFDVGIATDDNGDKTLSATEIAVALKDQEIKVKSDIGADVTLKAKNTGTSVTFEADANGVTVDVVNDYNTKTFTYTDAESDSAATATIKLGTETLGTMSMAKGASKTGADWAANFMTGLTDSQKTIDGIKYTVSNNNDKLTFEMVDEPTTTFTTNLAASVALMSADGTITYAAAGTDAKPAASKDNSMGAFINQGNGIGVHMDQQAVVGGDRMLAQGSLDLSTIVKDGAALKIGNKTYVFAVGEDSKFKNFDGADGVVDLTNHAAVDAVALRDASLKLSKVAAGNTMFDVSTDNTADTKSVRLTEKKDSGIDYAVNKLNGTSDGNLFDATR